MSNAIQTLAAPATRDRRRAVAGLSRRWLGTGPVVVLFLLWELASVTGILPVASIPPASDVIVAFGAQLVSGGFWLALWDTLSVALLGLVLIVLIAAPIALVIGLSRWWQESTWFVLEFLKPIPPVALIPLGLLLWGPSPGMKLFLIVFGAIWPLLTQLVYGLREVNGVAQDMAKSYRLGPWLTTTRLVFPSVLPFATTGLRISAAIAVVIAVVTEMIGGAAGLGQNIVVAQSANALAEMYALIIAAGLLGLGINLVFRFGEKPLLFWHPSIREEGKL
ncbi:ABC transporter permease [Arthrobacter crystallopoietes]|uniref:ABC transporter permease n=1 Tax=Crystallibacter crystallopoietes TaxID=37928 RepID=UPI001FCA162A|nr:ABC transporter permease subunit [Arthrobacter crystallopoietes]